MFERSQSWYEPDYSPDDNGYIHESDLPDLDHARDHLAGIVEAMYVTGDVGMLESCLDELCAVLDVESHPGEPKIEKANSKLMNWYLGYQRATIDHLRS